MSTKYEHLHDAIAAASRQVGGKLAPDKTNQEQRYDYLSADLILSICGQALADVGIAVYPAITEETVEAFAYVDKYGKDRARFDAKVVMAFSLAFGDHSISFPWVGRGSDYSVPDKATYKAITSGHKYFLMKLLNVGAGNEDGEHEAHEPQPAPRKSASELVTEITGEKPAPKASKPKANTATPAKWKADAIKWMVAEEFATNKFNASAMWDLLDLDHAADKAEAVKLVKLYRLARLAGQEKDDAVAHARAGLDTE